MKLRTLVAFAGYALVVVAIAFVRGPYRADLTARPVFANVPDEVAAKVDPDLPRFIREELVRFHMKDLGVRASPVAWGHGLYRKPSGEPDLFYWFAWKERNGNFRLRMDIPIAEADRARLESMAADGKSYRSAVNPETRITWVGIGNGWCVNGSEEGGSADVAQCHLGLINARAPLKFRIRGAFDSG